MSRPENPLERVERVEAAVMRGGFVARRIVSEHGDLPFLAVNLHVHNGGDPSVAVQMSTVSDLALWTDRFGVVAQERLSTLTPEYPAVHRVAETAVDGVAVQLSAVWTLSVGEAAVWRPAQAEGGAR